MKIKNLLDTVGAVIFCPLALFLVVIMLIWIQIEYVIEEIGRVIREHS